MARSARNQISRVKSLPGAKWWGVFCLLAGLLLTAATNSVHAQLATNSPANPNPNGAPAREKRVSVLHASDVVQVNVYQEEDMGAKARIENDGTISLPLLGKVHIGGKTPDDASKIIRDLLAKDYLVNPQVSVSVLEFAKRRFTVLGQVQKPGSYEFPADESLSLLQAIAIAGGYTRIGAPGKVTVQRVVDNETKTFKVDAEAMSKDRNSKSFEILPEDTITVGERLI